MQGQYTYTLSAVSVANFIYSFGATKWAWHDPGVLVCLRTGLSETW